MVESVIDEDNVDEYPREDILDAPPSNASPAIPVAEDFPMDYGPFSWSMNQYYLEEFTQGIYGDLFLQDLDMGTPSSGNGSDLVFDSLSLCSVRLVDDLDRFRISTHADHSPQDASSIPDIDMPTMKRIFSAENLKSHLSAFFRWTNVVIPLVHRPTFDIEIADPALLVSAFLCGSLYNPTEDVAERDACFDIAEEYVFSRLKEQVDLQRTLQTPVWKNRELVALMQAAMLTYGRQWITSRPDARRRSRKVRLPALLEVVRGLGFTRIKHAITPEGNVPSWEDFILLETCIR